jgi:hypothetical protein
LKDKPLAHILIFLNLLLSFLHTGPRPSRFLYLLGSIGLQLKYFVILC